MKGGQQMTMTGLFLAELERETPRTRRALEKLVPAIYGPSADERPF